MLRIFLVLFCAAPVFAETSFLKISKAVFSDRQLFWPGLEGGEEGSGKTKPIIPKPSGAKASLGPDNGEAKYGGDRAEVRIGILPIRIGEFRESLPCDSCHRLSANGMEFFLENYLKDRLQARFPDLPVELVAPHQPLLQSKVDLLAYLDSLDLPWDRWFGDSEQEVIYRPRDRFTQANARKRMDRLGGMLGSSHLLLPANLKVSTTPRSSITHVGGLEWSFDLVFWNVAQGSPEWAIRYSEKVAHMDLDESLAGRLDQGLGKAWDGLPGKLTALWKAEPR